MSSALLRVILARSTELAPYFAIGRYKSLSQLRLETYGLTLSLLPKITAQS